MENEKLESEENQNLSQNGETKEQSFVADGQPFGNGEKIFEAKEETFDTEKQLEKLTSESFLDQNLDNAKIEEVNLPADFDGCEDKFIELSKLLNKPVLELQDQAYLFHIQNLMKKLGKVIVKFNLTDAELDKIIYNGKALNLGEIVVSPAFVPSLVRHVKKSGLDSDRVNALIDFPFGESLYKAKLHDLKESRKLGISSCAVMMPHLILQPNAIKTFKKQAKSLGRIKKSHAGVVFSAIELDELKIKNLMKIVEKSKLEFVCFSFGDSAREVIEEKLTLINKFKQTKPIKVIANINSVEDINLLCGLNVDKILTPFADVLGEKFIEKFEIKSVELKK